MGYSGFLLVFIGGFTTFSTFSLDTAVLRQCGDPMMAFGYVPGSVVISIGALARGLVPLAAA